MRGFGDSLGHGSIVIDERWRIEVDTDGRAKVTIVTTFKNLSEKEQSLNEPYEIRFREEEKPDYIQCGGHTITDNSIPLNLTIQPSNDESITIDLEYTQLAKKEDSWWDISLNPRHGALSPHNLTIEIYLPMEAEDITFRHTGSEAFLVDHIHKTAVDTFTGAPYFFKLAYRLERPEQLEEQNSIPNSNSELTFSNEDIERVRNSMPLLNYFANHLSRNNEDKLFLGKTFIIALHFLKDLIIFLESFEKLGLESDKTYLFWKPYLYPHKDKIVTYLKNVKRYNIYPLDDLEGVLATQQDSMDNILVLEDGGYIAPLLHHAFEKLQEKTIGAVEQTTKGIRRDQEIEHIAIPILNVAEAEIKTRMEPPFVADAAIHNIENLLPETLRGKQIALMGLGAIGSEILERLKSSGANITPYDPEAIRRIEVQNKKGIIAEREAYLAVRDKFLVIGCSGETSIDRREILSLKHKTYLVSTSSDQVEINIPVLKSLSKPEPQLLSNSVTDKPIGSSYVIRDSDIEVRLLADGYPVNFWCSDSMPNQISDIILSAIFLSAFEIVKNRSAYPNGIKNVDDIVRKYEIAKIYEEHYHG